MTFISIFNLLVALSLAVETPLYFNPDDNNIRVNRIVLSYDISRSDKFKLGDSWFNTKDFSVRLQNLSFIEDLGENNKAYRYVKVLGFYWPQDFFQFNQVVLYSRTNTTPFLAMNIDIVNKHKWSEVQRKWKDGGDDLLPPFKSARNMNQNRLGHTNLGYFNVPLEIYQKLLRPFRICFENASDQGVFRVCTPHIFVNPQGESRLWQNPQPESSPTTPLAGKFEYSHDTLDVSVTNPQGLNIELKLKPKYYDIVDIVRDQEYIYVTGLGDPPYNAEILRDYHPLLKKVGWTDSFGEIITEWIYKTPIHTPIIPASGLAEQVLSYKIVGQNFPDQKHRLLVDSPLNSTYLRELKVKILKTEKKIKAIGPSSLQEVDGQTYWNFPLDRPLAYSSQKLEVENDGVTSIQSHRIYRGAATELSGRFTGVLTADLNVTILAEAAFNHWFESLLGWRQSWLTDRRWGISAKYFQSLFDFKYNVKADPTSIQSTNYDLKYRLNSGVWGFQETFGISAGYNSVSIVGQSARLLGFGAFWAKSMPQIFDDMLNIIPYFRYPKWVDMEFVLYPISLDANIRPGIYFNLNFHGKILWSESFFAEAGFGLKNIDFINLNLESRLRLPFLYGTVGVGYQF